MPKKGVSITLEEDNLLWLRGISAATGRGSLSETVDAIVSTARRLGQVPSESIRSVVGTVDIPSDDPDLEHADAAVAAWLDASLARPAAMREGPTSWASTQRTGTRNRGARSSKRVRRPRTRRRG